MDLPAPQAAARRGRPGYDQATVLRRAIELFNTQGYEATSIGDLARELGLTKSAIYHHVPSKESLLSAALDEALDGLSAAIDTAVNAEPAASAYSRLRTAVEQSVHILSEHLPAVTLLLRVRGNSEVELAALKRRRVIDEKLATLVQAAVDEGALRDDIPARRDQPAAVRHGQLAGRVVPPRRPGRRRRACQVRGQPGLRRARQGPAQD